MDSNTGHAGLSAVPPQEPTATATARGGIYDLPLVGGPAKAVRGFFDDMEPTADDSLGVAAGKEIIRYGAVVGAGAVGVAAGLIVVF